MKEIPLTQGKVAMVDDEDFEWLTKWEWTAHRCKNTFYADRHILIGEIRYTSQMHREIMGFSPYDGRIGDHKDRNGLNNQRHNLREVTFSVNSHNRSDNKNNTSGYRGVHWHKDSQKWQVAITVNGTRKHAGSFSNLISAAKAYDAIAIKHWGEDAILNFPTKLMEKPKTVRHPI